jgi:hypothetical protein
MDYLIFLQLLLYIDKIKNIVTYHQIPDNAG